ncbi:MAG TPA: flagellar assembly protein FliX [Alphaproteobacteria bacterium]|nr:flagellar assembly protein FliX [Alphaproteobacteria bacterium]
MDVSRISRSGQSQLGKPTKVTSSGGFTQMLDAKPTSMATVTGTAPAGAIDTLLAVQEAESALERRNRARRRASDLIDGLDQIRDGLLAGGISPDRLDNLAAMVAARRDEADDPRLSELLDEIELRVQVELAKLGRLPPGSV